MAYENSMLFEIDFDHAKFDSVPCCLTYNNQRHYICALGNSPLAGFINFLKDIAWQRFPASFTWGEDFYQTTFSAELISTEKQKIHLKIERICDEEPILVELDIRIGKLLAIFTKPLKNVAADLSVPGNEWRFSRHELNRELEEIDSGLRRKDVSGEKDQ